MNGLHAAFTGKLGGDAGLRYTANGSAMLTFSVAATEARDGQDPVTTWVRATAWGEQAEELEPKLVKGAEVYCEGRLRLNTWTGSDGRERTGLNLSAWTVTVMGQFRKSRRQGQNQRREHAMAGSGNGRRRNDEDDGLPF
ncbi:MAG: single-stranded DNA-binding protein [Chloroflexi bacterium]|nr:single-stranded DNA-binding protein [Chloroflexota bacterium]